MQTSELTVIGCLEETLQVLPTSNGVNDRLELTIHSLRLGNLVVSTSLHLAPQVHSVDIGDLKYHERSSNHLSSLLSAAATYRLKIEQTRNTYFKSFEEKKRTLKHLETSLQTTEEAIQKASKHNSAAFNSLPVITRAAYRLCEAYGKVKQSTLFRGIGIEAPEVLQDKSNAPISPFSHAAIELIKLRAKRRREQQ